MTSPTLGSPEFDAVLSLSSLFEKDFSIDWLFSLIQKKASQIVSALEAGVNQSWLKGAGGGRYAFTDAKKRKAWQNTLTSEEQERLHRQIVDILARDLPEDENKATRLAHHLLRIKNGPKGCRWLLRASDIHLKTYRPEDAFECYSKILEDLSEANGKEADAIFSEVAIKYSKVSTARHNTNNVVSVLHEGIIRAGRWKEKKCQALLEMHLAKNEWLLSRYNNALRRFEKGWSLANELNDPALHRSATNFRTFFQYWQGRFRETVSAFEEVMPDVDEFPRGRFPLLAGLTVGHCYAQVGQVTQGLGMLDAIYRHCLERGDLYLASNAGVTMGAIMVDTRLLHEALEYLEVAVENAKLAHNNFMQILGLLTLSYAYYLIDDKKQCQGYLHQFVNQSSRVHVTEKVFPYLLELCLAMKQGKIPCIDGLELENEILQATRGKNVFMKGMAYRMQALLQEQKNLPRSVIARSLGLSLKWLKESGHLVETTRTMVNLAQNYLSLGDESKSEQMTQQAAKMLSSLNDKMIPVDLRYLTKGQPFGENILNEIFDLSDELSSARNDKERFQRILSAANMVTGAERSALFCWEAGTHAPKLKASRNLDSEEITLSRFRPSMEMIEEVAKSGKGCILGASLAKNGRSNLDGMIRSRISVPILHKNKTTGVLYHDNRLLSSVFDESDLRILSYFASLVAFALEHERARTEIDRLNRKLFDSELHSGETHIHEKSAEGIVGKSPAIITVLEQVKKVAKTDSTVLILGETGVGKELVARAIHRKSERREKSFVHVNCSAFPETLIDSEIFGHEKGAFTGAIRQKAGRFEMAHRGTLFIDEVGTLPLNVQIKLLRVLQDKKFEKLGGKETLYSDFRLIGATNQDLQEEVEKGRFRLDLFYRLNVFPIFIPPLRERKEDIPIIAKHFLRIYGAKVGRSFNGIPREELDKLMAHDWPGNIRELENVIERGTILSSRYGFEVPKFTTPSFTTGHPPEDFTLKGNERRHILWALEKTGWKVRGPGGTAEFLEIPPSTLEYRMKKLKINRPGKRGTGRKRSKRAI